MRGETTKVRESKEVKGWIRRERNRVKKWKNIKRTSHDSSMRSDQAATQRRKRSLEKKMSKRGVVCRI